MFIPRVIARLDIKSPNLIKGIHLEGLRVIGEPSEHALKYYLQGADELLYIDIVASLYERNSLIELVKESTKNIFVPITVGGGLRTVKDVEAALKAGADKIAINTAAVKNPDLINETANTFGSQCMVLGVEAKKIGDNAWEVYYDNGRERTGKSVYDWCMEAVDRGAGEILLTSVDQEGTAKGLDLELINLISTSVSIPVIASGGAGHPQHVTDAFKTGQAEAVALAHMLHYNEYTIEQVKQHLLEQGLHVRL